VSSPVEDPGAGVAPLLEVACVVRVQQHAG
jgi:hypothetical protein